MDMSPDAARKRYREGVRSDYLQDLRGAEFQHLLRFAHAEGLLDELVQEVRRQGHSSAGSGCCTGGLSDRQQELESPPTVSPEQGLHDQRTAFEWSSLSLWFRSVSRMKKFLGGAPVRPP